MRKLYLGAGSARLECPQAKVEPGHRTDVHFVWQDGSEHAEHHRSELTCDCGAHLVRVGETDPWAHPFIEVEGEPHGA